MTARPMPAETGKPKSDWAGLQIRLGQIYRGAPRDARRLLPAHRTHPVTLWRVLDGDVRVSDGDLRQEAGPGEWLVCLPGRRLQEFTESARLLSVHLDMESFGNNAGWHGPHLVALGKDRALELAAGRLWKTAGRWDLHRDRYIPDERLLLPLDGFLELQQKVWALARRLLELLESHGVHFSAGGGRDGRVNTGLRWLAAQPLHAGFRRTELARIAVISPSRLDRLWRAELGMTPYQYWEQRRLNYANLHLRNPSCSIKEIAYALGFAHHSQFSTWFRNHQEESPSEFRSHADPL